MDSIMRLESLSKVYQTGDVKVRAVDGISLRIARGAFIAVTGPSGSGKSTLLHLMGGLDRPTEGSVIYQDKNLYDYRDNQLSVLRRRRFGFVFQSYNLIKGKRQTPFFTLHSSGALTGNNLAICSSAPKFSFGASCISQVR